MGRADAASDERTDASVGADECEVRLRVAAVDREQERRAHAGAPRSVRTWGRYAAPASSSRSSSSSATAYCPINGWVSSALRAVATSPVTAAEAVRRSYAAAC